MKRPIPSCNKAMQLPSKMRFLTRNSTGIIRVAASILAVLIIMLHISPVVQGQEEDEFVLITWPRNIPHFSDYATPVIKPGEKGVLNFSMENRPLKDSKGMIVHNVSYTDVRLTTEIYKYATIESSENVSEISSWPEFVSDTGPNPPFEVNDNGRSMRERWDRIETNTTEKMRYLISAGETTPQGTYFVRMEFSFFINETEFTMKSRGHFSKELWDDATRETDGKNEEGHELTGNVNLTLLGVDGILPDTSFSVKNPIPTWPIFLLGGITTGFGALAIAVYAYEEKSYPAFNRKVNHYLRKYNAKKAQFSERIDRMKRGSPKMGEEERYE